MTLMTYMNVVCINLLHFFYYLDSTLKYFLPLMQNLIVLGNSELFLRFSKAQ